MVCQLYHSFVLLEMFMVFSVNPLILEGEGCLLPSNIEVNMHIIGYQLPQVFASCSITKSSLSELGLVSLTGKIP